MKCHYVHDSIAGKVLIPGCWSVAVSGDMDDCICATHQEKENQILSKIALLEMELLEIKKPGRSKINRVYK